MSLDAKNRRGERLPRLLLAALALCAAALPIAGDEALAAGVNPVGLVPSGGVAVLRVDWKAVRADARLRDAIRGDSLERVFEQVGLRGGDVAEAVIFTDIAAAGSPVTAMILRGVTPLRPAAATLRAKGWGESAFRGYRVFKEGAGDSCVVGLRSGLLVVGTRGAVERVVNVESAAGRPQVADPNFRKLLARTSAARHPVALLLALPQEFQDAADVAVKAAALLLDFTGFSPLGALLDKVGLARGVGLSFTRRGDTLPLSMVAVMKDEGAASLVSGTITLLKGAASLMPARDDEPPDARRARRTFESMSVVRAREVVSVSLTLPEFAPSRH